MLCEFEAKNNIYLQKLVREEKVNLKAFPPEVIEQLRVYSGEVIREIVEQDAESRRVHDAYISFRKQIGEWADISEKLYYTQNL